MTLSTGLTDRLGIKGKGIKDLSTARLKGFQMFLFLGVEDPETVLTGCDILVKPTKNQTLGVGIFWKMALGKPVISIGSYDVSQKTIKWNPS